MLNALKKDFSLDRVQASAGLPGIPQIIRFFLGRICACACSLLLCFREHIHLQIAVQNIHLHALFAMPLSVLDSGFCNLIFVPPHALAVLGFFGFLSPVFWSLRRISSHRYRCEGLASLWLNSHMQVRAEVFCSILFPVLHALS